MSSANSETLREALVFGLSEAGLPPGIEPEPLARLVLDVLASEFGGESIRIPIDPNKDRRDRLILDLRRQGLRQEAIAKKAGCSRSTVSRVLTRYQARK